MAGENVRVRGLDDAIMALRALPRKLRIGAIRLGLRDAARIIQSEAKSKAPVLAKSTPARIRGLVRRSITVRSSKIARKRGDIGVFVTVARSKLARARGSYSRLGSKKVVRPNDPFYFRFLEDGTRKMSRRSFVGPALQARSKDAVEAFTTRLRKQVIMEDRRR